MAAFAGNSRRSLMKRRRLIRKACRKLKDFGKKVKDVVVDVVRDVKEGFQKAGQILKEIGNRILSFELVSIDNRRVELVDIDT